MIDIKLNAITHDTEVVDGDLVLIDDVDSIVQGLKIRLSTLKGEWFKDTRIGVVDVTVDKPDATTTSADIRAEIMKEDGVISIVEWESSFDAERRVLYINFVVETEFGNATIEEGVEI